MTAEADTSWLLYSSPTSGSCPQNVPYSSPLGGPQVHTGLGGVEGMPLRPDVEQRGRLQRRPIWLVERPSRHLWPRLPGPSVREDLSPDSILGPVQGLESHLPAVRQVPGGLGFPVEWVVTRGTGSLTLWNQ